MRVKVNGIHINYEMTGKGEPLVLIHGFGGDLTQWTAHLPIFTQHYQVITWDQRGFGQSDKPGEYSLKLFAGDLQLLLNALKIGRVFVLGTSWGGMIAQRFALDYPEMVKALVITSSSSEVNERAAKNYEARAEVVEKSGIEGLGAGLGGRFVSAFPGSTDRLTEAALSRPDLDARAYAGANRAVADLYQNPMTPELKKITCPTLIIGAGKDVIAGAGGSVIMHRNIPGSKLVMLQDCGHDIATERPDVFYPTILDFLASIKE